MPEDRQLMNRTENTYSIHFTQNVMIIYVNLTLFNTANLIMR